MGEQDRTIPDGDVIEVLGQTECGCGWTVPTTFPREPVRGDWCPIGPLNLHHWHDSDCVFCGGIRNGN
jgi:hypothetical protein